MADSWFIIDSDNDLWLSLVGSQEFEWDTLIEQVGTVWHSSVRVVCKVGTLKWVPLTGYYIELGWIRVDPIESNHE